MSVAKTRQQVLDDLGIIKDELKNQVGDIPNDTCTQIDKVIKTVAGVTADLRSVSSSRAEYTLDELRDIISTAESDLEWDISSDMDELRGQNEQLRHLGKFWYESYCELHDSISTLI